MLTKSQIRKLLEEIGYETIYEDPGLSGVRLQRKHLTRSDDAELGQIQAALSIMLEAAR